MIATVRGVWGVLTGLPVLVWPLLAALAWGLISSHGAQNLKVELASLKLAQAEATVKAVSEARAEERRIVTTQQGVINEQAQKLVKAEATLAAADSSIGKLLSTLARVSSTAKGGNPSPTGYVPTVDQLARNLEACVREYRSLGTVAVQAANNGAECAGNYDALNSIK